MMRSHPSALWSKWLARALRVARLGRTWAWTASSLISACGAGTAGIVAGAGDDGGGGSAPTITSFQAPSPKVSPTMLRLEANQSVQVELFRLGASSEEPLTLLPDPGVSGNQVSLAAGPNEVRWNFEADLGGLGFVENVDLLAKYPNGAPIDGGTLRLGVGNDPPVVLSVDPIPTDPQDPSESSGNVELQIAVEDSSSDVVTILVEWRRPSDPPGIWQIASAAGVFPEGIETFHEEKFVRTSPWCHGWK